MLMVLLIFLQTVTIKPCFTWFFL